MDREYAAGAGRLAALLVLGLIFAGCDRPDVDVFFTSTRYGPAGLYSTVDARDYTGTDVLDPTTQATEHSAPTWSPDGSRIAFASDRSIYTIRPGGTGQMRVASGSTEPLWSPDGSRIAFVSDRNIYTIRPDGTDSTLIARSIGGTPPTWSPDGSRLAFYTYKGDTRNLYTAPADGSGEPRQVTSHSAQDPTWAPDGSRIAYISPLGADSSDIFTIRPDGTDRTRVTNTPEEKEEKPQWSPDGSRIAYAVEQREGDYTISTIRPDGTERQQVQDVDRSNAYMEELDTECAWGPDGTQIVVYYDVGYATYADYSADEIHVVSLDESGGTQRLTKSGREPVWAPDGSRIAFTSNRGGTDEIYTMRPDGSGVRRVSNVQLWHAKEPALSRYSPLTAPYPSSHPRMAYTSNRHGNDEIYVTGLDAGNVRPDARNTTRATDHPASDTAPTWAPDRLRLAFASTRDGESNIYTIGLDGSKPKGVTDHEAADTNPAWGPGGLFSSSRIAFVSDRNGSPDIYTIAPDGSGLEQVTDHEAADADPSWTPEGERIVFASNRDGSFNIYTIAPGGTGLRQVTDHDASDTEPAWGPYGERIAFATDQDGYKLIGEIDTDGTRRHAFTRHDSTDTDPAWGLTGFHRYLWDLRKRAVQ